MTYMTKKQFLKKINLKLKCISLGDEDPIDRAAIGLVQTYLIELKQKAPAREMVTA